MTRHCRQKVTRDVAFCWLVRVALAVGVALILAGLGATLWTRAAIEWRRALEVDCETLCRSRSSACRAITEYGAICHDGTVWRRD